MNKALKVAWIPRLQTRTDASWKIIPEIALENYGGLSFLTHCNYDVNSLQMNHLPSFYREVLKQWQSTKQAFQNDTSPHDEIIWNNRNKSKVKRVFIRIGSKKIFYVLKTFSKMTEISFLLINFPKTFILKRRSLYILD